MSKKCHKCHSRHKAADVLETAPGSVLSLFHAAYPDAPKRISAQTAERDMCTWRKTRRDMTQASSDLPLER